MIGVSGTDWREDAIIQCESCVNCLPKSDKHRPECLEGLNPSSCKMHLSLEEAKKLQRQLINGGGKELFSQP